MDDASWRPVLLDIVRAVRRCDADVPSKIGLILDRQDLTAAQRMEAAVLLGEALLGLGRPAEALTIWEGVAASLPRNTEERSALLVSLGDLCRQMRASTTGNAYYVQALTESTGSDEVWTAVAMDRVTRGKEGFASAEEERLVGEGLNFLQARHPGSMAVPPDTWSAKLIAIQGFLSLVLQGRGSAGS